MYITEATIKQYLSEYYPHLGAYHQGNTYGYYHRTMGGGNPSTCWDHGEPFRDWRDVWMYFQSLNYEES